MFTAELFNLAKQIKHWK